MGLDSYWVENEEATEIAPAVSFGGEQPNMVGGMLSHGGAGPSFRGKVYDDLVHSLSGMTLYEEYLMNDQCQEIAVELKQSIEDGSLDTFVNGENNHFSLSKDQCLDFIRYWDKYVEAGYGLRGWW